MNARAPMSRPRLMDRHAPADYVASFNVGTWICIDAAPAVYALTLDSEGGVSARLCWMNLGRMEMSRKQLCHAFGEDEVLANETHAEEWAADRKEMFWR